MAQALADDRAAAESVVRCTDVTRRYGAVPAVDHLDVDVRSGELLALLGPSGCGKTTTLRLIAGFDRPDSGMIVLDGRDVASGSTFVPAQRRRVGVVFQDYALFPHLSVADNIAYGLRDRSTRRARVAEMLDLTGLMREADRRPHELSGGQQQRVALGRALAPSPSIVLLDEPFSNLDAALRARMRNDVRSIIREANATAVFVTHDQEEALSISDRVAVMRAGRLLQVGTPDSLYEQPADAFVATFVGDADLVSGHCANGLIDTVFGVFEAPNAPAGAVTVACRPERVRLRLDGHGLGVVTAVDYFGHDQLVLVALPDGATLRARLGPRRRFEPGDRVTISLTGEPLVYPEASEAD